MTQGMTSLCRLHAPCTVQCNMTPVCCAADQSAYLVKSLMVGQELWRQSLLQLSVGLVPLAQAVHQVPPHLPPHILHTSHHVTYCFCHTAECAMVYANSKSSTYLPEC